MQVCFQVSYRNSVTTPSFRTIVRNLRLFEGLKFWINPTLLAGCPKTSADIVLCSLFFVPDKVGYSRCGEGSAFFLTSPLIMQYLTRQGTGLVVSRRKKKWFSLFFLVFLVFLVCLNN